MNPQTKYPNPTDIDKIISCEIPNPDLHPRLYNLVKQHMMHGPCGLSPCMKNRKYSKFFPKKFNETTIVNQDGFPQYRRRANTHKIFKNGVSLDNIHVVPYNIRLLLKFQAHINMEWCNQYSSIKYLFKYIHKGYDRITASIIQAKKKEEVELRVPRVMKFNNILIVVTFHQVRHVGESYLSRFMPENL